MLAFHIGHLVDISLITWFLISNLRPDHTLNNYFPLITKHVSYIFIQIHNSEHVVKQKEISLWLMHTYSTIIPHTLVCIHDVHFNDTGISKSHPSTSVTGPYIIKTFRYHNHVSLPCTQNICQISNNNQNICIYIYISIHICMVVNLEKTTQMTHFGGKDCARKSQRNSTIAYFVFSWFT